jgi:hypothetical protein
MSQPRGTATIAKRLRRQGELCDQIGSPLYAAVLARAAEDVEAGGPSFDVLAGHEGDDPQSMLAGRYLGAVHRIALEGRAPELARAYETARETPGSVDAWPAFQATVAANVEELRAGVNRGVQTNEVGRCAALLGGFLLVAAETGLPLRLLEVGSSAGLNLRWDAFRYDGDGRTWGNRASPVRLELVPPLEVSAIVDERIGCDLNPVDPATEDGRLTLLSYVWPDMRWRWELVEAALDVAAQVPATVERSGVADWLESRLATPADGRATVVFHSIVMQYLPKDERRHVEALIRAAGERASDEAPLAWLRMEPDTFDRAGVWLDLWPGGRHAKIASAGYHGRPVDWSGW